ncbi:hypothetical protein PHMEG_0002284 [Phytophthora megakarya]|uniref:HAT C-terminal dimerisation domain-containing protein n=1 Tax=Phytophthora megakarya TaxID=4795 RepID=A0A225WZK5_9STRA|nr:hypothetical protein PHMEG_0002284 [Phytophthora megakarya]
MKTLNYAAALHLLISILNESFETPLRPILRQDTCWGLTYAMVERNFRIAELLPVDDDEVVEILPNARSVKRLRDLLAELKRVENVVGRTHGPPQGDIVHPPEFEIARAKERDTANLTAELQRFEVSDEESDDEIEEASFVAQLERKRKRSNKMQAYTLLNSIPPTSNILERFFSLARITYGHERHRLDLYTLEKILFLRVNKRLWNILIIVKWLKWVIMRDMAFTEVGNQLTRELTGLRTSDHICSKFVTTYIHALVPLVEVSIGETLPTRFAIICKEVLLGFSPPSTNKRTLLKPQRDLVVSLLSVDGKTSNDVVALMGDNCPTNKATGNLLGINLLGCSCHKLILAIGRIGKTFGSVATLASKENTLKSAAALRELTELVVVRRNDTRWPSSYNMVKRFFEIEMELRQLPELEMPRQSDLQLLREFMPTLAGSMQLGLVSKSRAYQLLLHDKL